MEPNSNRSWSRNRERLRELRSQNLRQLRTKIRRASDGKVLGVFKGIADSMGWSVRLTRIVGAIALLSLTGTFGVSGFSAHLLGCGFFYLLAAALMGAPRPTPIYGGSPDDSLSAFGEGWRSSAPGAQPPPAAVPYSQMYRPRLDLAALDRQVESLNRRIRRMESVVTDPGYDWERRLGK